jgi:hypothetical protein
MKLISLNSNVHLKLYFIDVFFYVGVANTIKMKLKFWKAKELELENFYLDCFDETRTCEVTEEHISEYVARCQLDSYLDVSYKGPVIKYRERGGGGGLNDKNLILKMLICCDPHKDSCGIKYMYVTRTTAEKCHDPPHFKLFLYITSNSKIIIIISIK